MFDINKPLMLREGHPCLFSTAVHKYVDLCNNEEVDSEDNLEECHENWCY